MARLARVAQFADGSRGRRSTTASDRCRPPRSCAGWPRSTAPVDQFNQTVAGAGPRRGRRRRRRGGAAGAAGPARHAADARRRPTMRRAGRCVVPEAGTVDARDCLHTSSTSLSDEAVVAARSRLDPADRRDAQRAVGDRRRAAGRDRPPPRRRRGVVANPAGGPEHRVGPAPGRAAGRAARRAGRRSSAGRDCSTEHAAAPGRRRPRRDAWGRSPRRPPRCPPCRPAVDTFATAGHLSVGLDAETTGLLLGAVPAAFHAGVQDILLIGFALAVRGVRRAATTCADRHRRRGPRAPRGARRRRRGARPVPHRRAGSPRKYPVVTGAGSGCPGRR